MEIKEILGIEHWKDINTNQIIKLIELSPKIDKDTFEKILKQIPNIIENNKAMLDGIVNVIEKNKEINLLTKEVYKQMINAIKDIINKEGSSEEVKIELIKIMDRIREDLKDIDKRDRIQENEQMDKIIKFAEKTLIILSIGIGIRFVVKKGFKII